MGVARDAEIVDQALERLRSQAGITAEVTAVQDARVRTVDRQVLLTQGGKSFRYWALCKAKVERVSMLHEVQARLQSLGQPGLLITTYLSPALAGHCQAIGLSYLDTAGNVFLHDDGLFVLLSGHKPKKGWARPEKAAGAFHGTGLQVVFALLAEPRLLQAPYREIARAAGAALGTTSQSLTALRERGFLVTDGKGVRRWVDRQRVLQTWATNFPLALRGRLHPRRYRAQNEDWWKNAHPEAHGGFWSGEVAAANLIQELVPMTATVYLPEDRSPFLATNRLWADPLGSIEVLDVFWKFGSNPATSEGIAPPLLIYADLVDQGDPRTEEQAMRIHERYLA